MSQVTHPSIPLTTRVRSPRRTVSLAALLALAAGVAVVLVLALGAGGPDHSSVVSGVGSRPIGPDEARIATLIGRATPQASSQPNESRIAAAVGARSPSSSRPDESRTAAAISGR